MVKKVQHMINENELIFTETNRQRKQFLTPLASKLKFKMDGLS